MTLQSDETKLDMTPMIDCVFQLLIFFIIALKPEDLIAHLDVTRPTTPPQVIDEPLDPPISITILNDRYMINERQVSGDGLASILKQMARLSLTQAVIIKCSADSSHARLVEVLDLCAAAKLKKLSVMSL